LISGGAFDPEYFGRNFCAAAVQTLLSSARFSIVIWNKKIKIII
jgi:hypothetical protein